MVVQFTPAIRQVIQDNPQLQGQEPVKVLMTLVATHTRVLHGLRKMGYPVQRVFSTIPYTYDFISEGSRSIRFGKQVDRTMAGRIILANILSTVLTGYNNLANIDSQKRKLLLRKMATQFSYEEIQEMIEGSWATAQDGNFMRYFPKKLFEAKGIRIPTTVNEVDVYLSIDSPRKPRKKRRR
jgi:hypothetical protein